LAFPLLGLLKPLAVLLGLLDKFPVILFVHILSVLLTQNILLGISSYSRCSGLLNLSSLRAIGTFTIS
jgi:hypothetical protein